MNLGFVSQAFIWPPANDRPMPEVSVVGLGRVGLATGVAFAKFGHEVACYDIDPAKAKAISAGKHLYHEKRLGNELRKVLRKGNFTATDNAGEALVGSSFYFICTGTPPLVDGSMDTKYVAEAAKLVGMAIKGRKNFPVVVVKSTVIPGTTEEIVAPALMRQSRLGPESFGLCMNPEFLREGTAIEDTLKPDRIVIGSNDNRSGDVLENLHTDFDCVKWRCDIKTAEMVKYASNAFLATKVTFANEIANICGVFGLDADRVLEGMALDSRIGQKFLVPGVGFGGPCLSKDIRAVMSASSSKGYEPNLLKAVMDFNERQAVRAVKILEDEIGDLSGSRIALLGLAFKADTDDVRDSTAIPIIQELLKHGATVIVHDPAASVSRIGEEMAAKQVSTIREALKGSDGCIIQASWREYKELGKDDFSVMKKPIVVDGRRTLDRRSLPKGIIYRRIG